MQAGAVHSGDQDNSGAHRSLLRSLRRIFTPRRPPAMLAANVDGVVSLLQSIVDHGCVRSPVSHTRLTKSHAYALIGRT